MADSSEKTELFDYPGRARSSAWKYFGFRKVKEGPPIKENLESDRVVCRLCFRSYSNNGNTTNLQTHLEKHHKHETHITSKSASGVPSRSSHPTPTPPKQPRIDTQLFTGKVSNDKKRKLDDHIQKLVVGKCLPLSLVDSSYFKNFVKELDSRYKAPSKHDLKILLEKKRSSMKDKLSNDLPPAESHLAITHDSWTSMATQSYDTVTAHFINDDWEIRSAVLQTSKIEGSHTSERIAERLQETVSKWRLPRQPTAVTDNAANERKAIEQVLGWPRFGCYGHRLNLAVKHALDVHEVGKILGKARKTVTLFHQSTSLTDSLLEKQRLLYTATPSQIGLKLVADVPTRWNSSLAMLERLSQQSAAIFAVASDDSLTINKSTQKNLRTYCFTFEEQAIVDGLIQILTPFEKATTILCAESVPTMHKVIVCTIKINRILEASAQSSSILKKVVGKLQEQLEQRAKHEDIPVLAALLNPDTKSLSFLPEQEQIHYHKLLLEKALEFVDENGNFLKLNVKKEKSDKDVEIVPPQPLPDLPTPPELTTKPLVLPPPLPELSTLPETTTKPLVPSKTLPELPSPTTATKPLDPIPLLKDVPTLPSGSSVDGPTPNKIIKCSDMEGWFDDVVISGVSSKPSVSVVEEEVQRYLGCGRDLEDENLSILQWWKKTECMYPRLSILARKYLAIPASSVPSERVFSLAGALVSKKRARLNPDMVDSLIFLKMNMENYW